MPVRVPTFRINRLIAAAHAQGWRTKETRNQHVMFFPPNGGQALTFGFHTKHWDTMMSQLKAAGFNTFEEAMNQAKSPGAPNHPRTEEDDANEAPIMRPKPVRGQLQTFVLDMIKARPEHDFTSEEVFGAVRNRFSSTIESVQQTLYQLKSKGAVSMWRRGHYRWVAGSAPAIAAKGVSTKTEPMAPPIPTPVAARPPTQEILAGQKTGDMTIDKALDRIDTALAALSQIGEAVSWIRQQYAQIAELKRALEQFK